VQMRILAAMINLRVMMRGATGSEIHHRPMAKFFHLTVIKHCERKACACANWLARAAEAEVEMGDAGNGGDGGGTGGSGGGGSSGIGVDAVVIHDDELFGIDVENGCWGVDYGGSGNQQGAAEVGNAGSVGVEGRMGAEVLNGPQLPPGADVVSAVDSEASEASDSHSSAWESERDRGCKWRTDRPPAPCLLPYSMSVETGPPAASKSSRRSVGTRRTRGGRWAVAAAAAAAAAETAASAAAATPMTGGATM